MRLLTSSFIPQLKNSCRAMLGFPETLPATVNDRLEQIRQLMLSELGEYGEKKFPSVARRVRFAPDVQGLWYARSDVMAILANTHGETLAREKLQDISGKFNGLLPKGLTQRSGMRAR